MRREKRRHRVSGARSTGPVASWIALGLAVVLPGCGWFGGDAGASADDEAQPIETVTVDAPLQPDAPEQTLEFNVPVGTRFPLLKTVEQSLQQATPEGTVESRSRLRLQMVITVDDVHDDGSKTLSVHYHRVGYDHDIAGEEVQYDSAVPPTGELAPSLQAYHGLVGNGFSFVIGPDNVFREVHDFRGFLAKCLREVPAHRRDSVLAELELKYGEEGIANFIDDSLGILPYDVARPGRETVVREDQTWRKKWKSARPVPMLTDIEYKLLHLGEEVAEVLVHGQITQSSTFGPSDQPNEQALVVVDGGTVDGHCSIRRDTGLPVRSRIRRAFKMVVRMPDGQAFDQFKEVVTTIETFQEHGTPHRVPAVVPVSSERSGSERPVRVESADFESR